MTLLAWTAALVAALGYGAASVLQGAGARKAAGPAVLVQPAYVVGLCCDGAAWLASLVAVRVLPLVVVQSVLAGSVAVTVVLAAVYLEAPLRARDVGAVVGLGVALAVLAAAVPAGSAVAAPGLTSWVLGGGVVVVVATAALYRRGGSLPLSVLAGAAFAGTAVSARTVVLTAAPVGLLAQPLAWAVPALGLVGTLAFARSLERGPTGPATATLWSVETVVGGLAGVLLAGDVLRPGWAGLAVAAVVVVLVACGTLASGTAERIRDQPVGAG